MASYVGRGVHGQTVEDIARRILTGEIGVGETIDIAELESRLDVSRSTMREALKVLAAKGLVDARQKRGTFVRPRSDWHLLDRDVIRWQFTSSADNGLLGKLSEVRSIVEPAGARLAAERRTEADLAELESALAAMAAANSMIHGDPGDAESADLRFHRALLAATHNELLERMEMVIETGVAERDRMVHGAGVSDLLPSHRAVYEAIRSANPDRAERAMRDLLATANRDTRRANGRAS